MSTLSTANLPDASALDEVIGNAIESGVSSTRKLSAARLGAQLLGTRGPNYRLHDELEADLAWTDQALGFVFGDGDNNGTYRKSGAAGSGSWTRIGDLPFITANGAVLDALISDATTARDEAQEAADAVADQSAAVLRADIGAPTSNPQNKAIRNAAGNWTSTTGGLNAPYWDYELTPEDLAAETVHVDCAIYSGIYETFTVEQRDAAGQVAAPVVPPVIRGRRRLVLTLDPQTTILRITIDTADQPEFGPISVTAGPPLLPPQQADYLTAFLRALDDDTALTPPTSRIISADTPGGNNIPGTITGPETVELGPGDANIIVLRVDESAFQDTDTLALTADWSNATGIISPWSVVPVTATGETGDTVALDRVDLSYFHLRARLPARLSGHPVTELHVTTNTRHPQGGDNAATTARFRVYRDTPPILRSVPEIIGDYIKSRIDGLLNESAVRALVTEMVTKEALRLPASRVISDRDGGLAGYAALIDHWVDSERGDDANGDGSKAAPWATIKHAKDNSGDGAMIGLVGDDPHFIEDTNLAWRGLVGLGPRPAFVDARQRIGGGGWTDQGGGLWSKTVTFRQATTANDNGIKANTTHYAVAVIEDVKDQLGTALIYQYAGESLAANREAVRAAPGSFTINLTGDIAPDPRQTQNNGAQHDIYLHLPDGGNPNLADVRTHDQQLVASVHLLANIETVGAYGKDNVHPNEWENDLQGKFGSVQNVNFHRCPAHGFVAPAYIRPGYYKADGRTPEGFIPAGADQSDGRAAGGGVNFYRLVTGSDDILIQSAIFELKDFSKAIYGHPSEYVATCYRDLIMSPDSAVYAENCGQIFQFDWPNIGGSPFISRRVETWNAYAKDADSLIVNNGIPLWVHDGGKFVGKANPAQGKFFFIKMDEGGTVHLKNYEFETTRDTGTQATKQNFLVSGKTGKGGVLILEGCRDVTVPLPLSNTQNRTKLHLDPSDHDVVLHVRGGTSIGDLYPFDTVDTAPAEAVMPSGLFVEPGCELGLGNRSRAQIRAAFLARGLTEASAVDAEDGDFFIHPATTIVGAEGQIIDWPA